MKVTPTRIKDVLLIEPQVKGDARGFFMETYHQQKYAEQGLGMTLCRITILAQCRVRFAGCITKFGRPRVNWYGWQLVRSLM
jgi:dTDP-4-dehydrorhamnose 3,5-epimerase-like enzyme